MEDAVTPPAHKRDAAGQGRETDRRHRTDQRRSPDRRDRSRERDRHHSREVWEVRRDYRQDWHSPPRYRRDWRSPPRYRRDWRSPLRRNARFDDREDRVSRIRRDDRIRKLGKDDRNGRNRACSSEQSTLTSVDPSRSIGRGTLGGRVVVVSPRQSPKGKSSTDQHTARPHNRDSSGKKSPNRTLDLERTGHRLVRQLEEKRDPVDAASTSKPDVVRRLSIVADIQENRATSSRTLPTDANVGRTVLLGDILAQEVGRHCRNKVYTVASARQLEDWTARKDDNFGQVYVFLLRSFGLMNGVEDTLRALGTLFEKESSRHPSRSYTVVACPPAELRMTEYTDWLSSLDSLCIARRNASFLCTRGFHSIVTPFMHGLSYNQQLVDMQGNLTMKVRGIYNSILRDLFRMDLDWNDMGAKKQ